MDPRSMLSACGTDLESVRGLSLPPWGGQDTPTVVRTACRAEAVPSAVGVSCPPSHTAARCPGWASIRLLGVSLLLLLLGCGTDFEAEVDAKVTQQWMRPGLYTDAVAYLENGGRYHDMPGPQDLDREAIMPFLRDLQEEFEQEQYAILLEDEDYAWGFVMKIPPGGRGRVEEYLQQAKQTFPGMILEEWGHEWLSLDFLNEEEAEFIRKSEAAAEAS